MRSVILTLALLLGVVILAACGHARTKVTSVRDPGARSSSYHKLVVFAPFSDLESRKEAEAAFIDRLGGIGVQGIASMTLVPPTREMSDAEITAAVKKAGADGVLLVS